MKAAAEHIHTELTTNTTISNRLTNGVHWEFCTDENTPLPLATFTVVQSPAVTKNFSGAYEVSVFVYDTSIDEAAETADIIKQEMTATTWKFSTMRSGYTADEAQEAFIEIVFTFNL